MEELKKKIERLGRQSAQMLTQLALSDLQLRALNMGQDRFRRRLWILPHAGGVYLEALESGEANAGPLGTWDGKPAPPIGPQRNGDEPDEPMPEVPTVKSEPISDEHKPTLPVPKTEQEDKETPSLQEPMEVDQPPVKTELVEEAAAAVKSEESTQATAGMIPETADAVPRKEEEAQEALPALWFSLFPRTPCDRNSSANQGKDRFGSDAEDEGEGRVSKKEEAAKEEAEKIVMQPIPEGVSHKFCFYDFPKNPTTV